MLDPINPVPPVTKKFFFFKKKIKGYINRHFDLLNFFLLNFDFCKLSANYVLKKLEKKGIILRSMESYKMKNKLRVTIGSSKENNKFIKNLDHIL